MNNKIITLSSFLDPNLIEAGVDEAGRGPLAGPLFVSAVILDKNFRHPLLNDSKKMSPKNRLILKEIIEKEALAYSVVMIDAKEIDKLNILNATFKGMNDAVKNLKIKPQYLLIDGNKFINNTDIPFSTIVKGDGKFASIAAASVLAKTYRDEYMMNLSKEYPEYHWDKNMGYPTKEHIEAIRKYGYTIWHRKSFHVKTLL